MLKDRNVLEEDSISIAESDQIEWDKIANKSILITGATGLIGATIIRGLLARNHKHNSNIRVYALTRNKEKAKRVFGDDIYDDNLHIVVGDVTEKIRIDYNLDYVIHGASETSSNAFVEKPAETIRTTINGTLNILDLCREKAINKLVFLSSMEVYGTSKEERELNEDSSEYLNPLTVRSSYPESKRMAENICTAYLSEYNTQTVIARLTQTFGPGIEAGDNRVFAQFAKKVIQNEDIVLLTKGQTKRMYVYTADAAIAILILLTKGGPGEAYNIANPETYCSIADMAGVICKEIAQDRIKVEYKEDNDLSKVFNPVQYMKLNVDKIYSLGWKPKVSLIEMYRRMISVL